MAATKTNLSLIRAIFVCMKAALSYYFIRLGARASKWQLRQNCPAQTAGDSMSEGRAGPAALTKRDWTEPWRARSASPRFLCPAFRHSQESQTAFDFVELSLHKHLSRQKPFLVLSNFVPSPIASS
jgi:hypothetical protein